ncbi:MAG: DUF1614 domain-containing protein [Clostridia bacterium]|nr:DUF1614 domain-containing protein [Clostridia bacterium]
MSIGMVVLTVVAVLIFFGVLQRVLDRMHLTDRMALLLVAAMFVGTLLPNVELGMVSVNIGGAVIPLGVCVYLFVKADESKERLRAVIGAVVTGGAVYALSVLLPDEPEAMFMDPNLLYGLVGGAVAWLLGRSRRGAFICGVVGVILADVATAVMNWSQGIHQQLVLGGAGIADTVVISGVLAVLLAELVGEVVERMARRRKEGSKA